MKKRKIYLIILIFTSLYFMIRLLMKIALIEKSYTFVYNAHNLELLLPYTDVTLTVLFFLSLYVYFKEVLAMKYISIALMIFFIPFSIVVSFLSVVLKDEQSRHPLSLYDQNEKHLLIVNHVKGLHPDVGDPREVYLYKKLTPHVYKKIGQTTIAIESYDFKDLSNLKINEKVISVDVNGKTIYLEN
ncbi:hypothetical protein [Planococcus halocryophilus]|uniref:Uncharacterized protein n=1 Tax=Planococcus halocryophilus TaxID=1215089 RepID=A0A1C7DQ66_9BACL|nr:hypothetical protein [Planococcus halocryophilus]ANU13343.1 hypothetical protein BBI08_05605 [Planococcus halocryophilus]